MGRSMLIANPSPASKNTSRIHLSAQQQGLRCEQIALDHYLSKYYQLVGQRVKTPFAEVDLVLKSPQDEIVLVEVKSLSSFDFLAERISKTQKQRLIRAHRYFLTKHDRVRLELAVVSHEGELLIFDEVFG